MLTPAGFVETALEEALCAICGGVIGQLMRVVFMAMRRVARSGREAIELAAISERSMQPRDRGTTLINPGGWTLSLKESR